MYAAIRHAFFVAILCLAAAITMPVAASNKAPGYISELIGEPGLIGTGTLRWFGLKIYSASLWSANPASMDPVKPAGAGTAMVLTYARSLKGRLIAKRSVKELSSLGFDRNASLPSWSSELVRIFPDVINGDQLAGVIDRLGATRFFLNGKPIGTITDPQFGPAFFSIWLDRRTSAPDLRARLFGLEHRSGQSDSGFSDDTPQ